ncbi:MAG TPA: acyl-CoA/acyl-ACP dehydrogenase [Candidatus Atopostipes pullistercoris]|uniref:Acyl-CoA/acyl-ACP dehydrogenase n=1 Tax=Candidatus Atopostipes pullistercoris TaxID=2838467 RepID=A0A9D2G2Q2_9LACT|nr:acyl-CoA/acyl-ACP dehydrogenase [Candidatus Atopostipes pullistercoris]
MNITNKFFLEDHNEFLKEIETYTQNNLAPVAKEYDESGEFPTELLPFFFEHHSFNFLISDSKENLAVFLEMIRIVSTKFASLASILLTQGLYAVSPFYSFGTEKQKDSYLKDLINGNKLGGFAMTEDHSGSDLSYLETTAWETENGWTINGSKKYVSNAAKADLFLVVAKANKLNGETGIGIFIVKRSNEGLNISDTMDKMGIKSLPVSSINLDKAIVPKNALLGETLNGEEQVEQIMNLMKLAVSMQAIGISQGSFEKGLHYLSLVRKFGNRLIDNQITQQTMADMNTNIHSAEAFTRYIILDDPQDTVEVAMAKILTANTAIETTETMIQLTGGYGYMKDSEIERYVRDAKITSIYGGSSDSQRKIVAQPWLKK